METKRIQKSTLAVAILSLLLIASLVLSATGAWFTSTDSGSLADQTFGTIELGEVGATPFAITKAEGDVVMPGDKVDVDFSILNNGTADMFIRFKVTLKDPADDSEIVAADGDYPFSEDLADLNTDVSLDASWVYNGNAAAGNYYYKNVAVANGAAQEDISFDLTIATSVGDTYEGEDFYIELLVEAVQSANNSAADYTAATWPGSFEFEANA